MKIHEVDEETVMLDLEPTQYYTLWNKWDLYEYLLEGHKKMTFYVEDFPMDNKKLFEYGKELKEIRKNTNGLKK